MRETVLAVLPAFKAMNCFTSGALRDADILERGKLIRGIRRAFR